MIFDKIHICDFCGLYELPDQIKTCYCFSNKEGALLHLIWAFSRQEIWIFRPAFSNQNKQLLQLPAGEVGQLYLFEWKY